MVEAIKYSVSLAAVACLTALPVSFVHDKTFRKAADASVAMREAAVREVIPGNGAIMEKRVLPVGERDSTVCWMSTAGGDTVVAFTVDISRYPGTVSFAVGVGTDGTIRGMRVVGGGGSFCLGDMQNVAAQGPDGGGKNKKKMLSQPWFPAQFVGLSTNRPIAVDDVTGEWHKLDSGTRKLLLSHNEVTAVTGATLSTRTIARMVAGRAKRILNAVRS